MQEKAEKVSTTLDLRECDASKIMSVISTMTGKATEWDVSHGHYLSLDPNTNMDKVRMTFWSRHIGWLGDRMTEEEMDELRATLKKSRRWKYRLIKK